MEKTEKQIKFEKLKQLRKKTVQDNKTATTESATQKRQKRETIGMIKKQQEALKLLQEQEYIKQVIHILISGNCP